MMNQLRRLQGKYFRQLTMSQLVHMSGRNNHKGAITNIKQDQHQVEIGTNLLRAQYIQQSDLKEQKNQVNLMSEKNDIDFQKEYSQQHYSKKKAMKDVVESLFFQDHTEKVQYEYLNKLSQQNANDENDANLDDLSLNKANQDLKISETDLKNNFDSLQNFLEEDLELTNGQYKNLVNLSSSAKTAVSNNDGSIHMKKIPENSYDILPIIENIHLNCHLLAFFVKYQKFFFSIQYYALLTKLKQNTDDLEYIKEFEMNKYEQKRKALQEISPQSKLKFKPVFLNVEETKAHFGYQILIRNLKQKFQYYDARKSIQIMKAYTAFDKNVDNEFFDLIGKRFLELKNEFSTYELVAYHFLLAAQCEKSKTIVNHDMQIKIIDELLLRDETEFSHQILNLIVKLRVMYPLLTVSQMNLVLFKMQNQFTRFISNFNTKQLLEIAMIFLVNNIHFQKHFAEILFISILKNLPQEKQVKSKAVIQILNYFKKQNLYYLQRIDNDNEQIQQQLAQQSQANKDMWSANIINDGEEIQEEGSQESLLKTGNEDEDFLVDMTNRQKEDSLTKVFKNSIKTALKIDGLFDALLSSVAREISSGVVLKPYSLHTLINVIIQNQVKKQAYYDLFISEYAKILPKASFLMFARMYQILSDQRLIQKPLHILSAAKIKKNLKTEYVSYQKTQQLLIQSHNTSQTIQNQPNSINNSINNSGMNSYDQRQSNERQVKLTRLLLLKLNFCISNLWSYVLNCVRFEMIEQTDADILSSAIIYSNSLIADIDKYLDSQLSATMQLVQNAQQINNFVELEMKKIVPPININKLVSNVHINVVDENNHLRYSTKLELLFQLHKRQFNLKYSPFIERNALVDDLIYDVKIKNIETSSSTLLNIISMNHYNYQGQERGITYLKRHFSQLKAQPFVMIDFKEFEDFIIQHIQSGDNHAKNIPNFIEFKLQDASLPSELKFPQEVQNTLELFEQQIAQIYKECKIEYKQQKVSEQTKSEKLVNKFSKYSSQKNNVQEKQPEIKSSAQAEDDNLFDDITSSEIKRDNLNITPKNKFYQID